MFTSVLFYILEDIENMNQLKQLNWNPEIPDQRVRKIRGGLYGKTIGKVEQIGGYGLTATIKFGDNKIIKVPVDELKYCPQEETIKDIIKEKLAFSSHLILRQILSFYKIKLSREKLSFYCSINLNLNSRKRLLIIYLSKQEIKQKLITNLTQENIKYQELFLKELLDLPTINDNINGDCNVYILSLQSILSSKNNDKKLDIFFKSYNDYFQEIVFYGIINALKNKESPTYQIAKKISDYQQNLIIFHQDINNEILTLLGKVEQNDNFINFLTKLKQEEDSNLSLIETREKVRINTKELMTFVIDSLELQYGGTIAEQIEDEDQFKDILKIKLSDSAQGDLKDFCEQFQPRLRTFLTDHECKCIFNFAEKPSKIPPCVEFIDLEHPLIKWLVNPLELKHLSFVPVCAINLEIGEVKKIKTLSTLTKGNYFYSVYFLAQNKTNCLIYQVINLEDKTLLESAIAQELIEFASREGKNPMDAIYQVNQIPDYYDDYLRWEEKITPMGGINISAGLIYLK